MPARKPKKDDDDVTVEEELQPSETIKKLRDRLRICERERREYLEGWQRSKADFINGRKSLETAAQERVQLAERDLIERLLPTLDGFEMAVANRDAWERVDREWRTGVEQLHQQLQAVMGESGLEAFSPLGEVFDPSRHDSVELVTIDSPDKDNRIVEVLKRGYLLRGKVLRPATVKIGHFEHLKT